MVWSWAIFPLPFSHLSVFFWKTVSTYAFCNKIGFIIISKQCWRKKKNKKPLKSNWKVSAVARWKIFWLCPGPWGRGWCRKRGIVGVKAPLLAGGFAFGTLPHHFWQFAKSFPRASDGGCPSNKKLVCEEDSSSVVLTQQTLSSAWSCKMDVFKALRKGVDQETA